MAKAAEAFRTISEVADDLEIPKHVLRFWEAKFTHIRPMKRGGGRRYYRPEDMEILKGIRYLLHRDGYTIKGVQKILREQGVEIVKQRGRGEALSDDSGLREADGAAPLPRESASAPLAQHRNVHPPAEKPRGGLPVETLRLIKLALTELELCRATLKAAGESEPRQQRRAG